MKLKYDFEIMNVGDSIVAVPVGENANQLRAMITLSPDSKEVLEVMKDSDNPEDLLKKLLELHPEEEKNELAQQLCDFLNKLIKEGLLEP